MVVTITYNHVDRASRTAPGAQMLCTVTAGGSHSLAVTRCVPGPLSSGASECTEKQGRTNRARMRKQLQGCTTKQALEAAEARLQDWVEERV